MEITQTKLSAAMYMERITDLEKRLREERKKRLSEQKKIDDLEKENEELRRKLGESEKKTEEQEEEIDRLNDSRKVISKMIFKEKTEGQKRRGRKKGHEGKARKKPSGEFIKEEVNVTAHSCPKCDAGLNGCKRTYERIVEDIVLEPRTSIISYLIHQYECGNCGEKVSPKPHDAVGQSPFGKKTFALALYYRYYMKTPLAKI